LREETRQKLNAIARSERTRNLFALAFTCVLVGVAGLYLANSYPVAERSVSGVVRWAVWRVDPDTGQRYPDIQIMLSEGRLVPAATLERDLPDVGSDVNVIERIWALGPATYRWDRPTGSAGKP